MASKAEQHLSRLLRTILASFSNGARISESEHFRDCLSGLEFFLTEVLGEIHPEWKHERLDGIYPLVAKKTGEGEAEIFGQCILISDQTLTPMHLRIQESFDSDEIQWLELRLGERSDHGMVRTPYESPSATIKHVYELSDGDPDQIEWCYRVTFGDRRG